MISRETHSPPRIGCVFEHPTLSGGERSMLEVIRCLPKRYGWCAYAPPVGPLWEALQHLGVETHAFERTRQPADGLTPAELTAERLARCARVDLLHGNSLSTAQFTGLAAQRLGVPAVAHVREIERLNPTRVQRMNRNTRLVAVSAAVRDHLLHQGCAPEHVVVIHNGVDLDLFHPSAHKGLLRRELGIPITSPVVATIGQISLRKATEIYLESVTRAGATLDDLHAVIVGARFGTKPESLAFEEVVAKRCARSMDGVTLHLVGWRDDIPAILPDIDLYVHCARQEPFGRVLLEASAAGVPIIATAVGGTPEIVDDGMTGWLVEKDNPVALAARIRWALNNPLLRTEAGRQARLRAEKNFSGLASAERLATLYDDTLAQFQP